VDRGEKLRRKWRRDRGRTFSASIKGVMTADPNYFLENMTTMVLFLAPEPMSRFGDKVTGTNHTADKKKRRFDTQVFMGWEISRPARTKQSTPMKRARWWA
jgi:hypothetical protein